MMNILQFKTGGEYDYNITFETGLEKQKIQTNDRPQGDLLKVISNVVVSAVDYFRFDNIAAQFRQISFSYPEKGCDTFVLELSIKTKENIYIKHILKTEKLELAEDDTESNDTNYSLRITQSNNLVKNILKLREEIIEYVNGARLQEALPFEESEETDEGDSLFDEE